MNRRQRVIFVPMQKFREISVGLARLVLPSGAEIIHATETRDEFGPGIGYLVTAPTYGEVPIGYAPPRARAVIEEVKA